MAASTMALSDVRNAVVYEAAIDGQTGSTSRHSTTRLNELINRKWASLRSLVSAAGEPWYQVVDSITAIPAATSGEDFIELTYPSAAAEITGVDVQIGGGLWTTLEPASWSQRRLMPVQGPTGGPYFCRGYWAIKSLPEARSSASVTDGKLAIWPETLTGNYRITYVENWVALTTDSHVFVAVDPEHFQWLICACVAVVTKRDHSKKDIYAMNQAEMQAIEARIIQKAKRVRRGGAIVPMRKHGEIF